MKEFCCGAVVPGCTAVFHATSEEDILVQVASHAFDDHHMTDIPDALVAEVRRHITAAPVATA
jgi:predicted small metal-binding protein